MCKYFTVVFLLLTTGLFSQNITATQKIPGNAMPGTDFIIETTINKGKVNGFMKFFQEIPEGLIASEIESRNGTFSFADGGAKIVWVTPPSDEVFTISYKVTVNGGVSGLKSLPAKVSYIDNNERKIFDLPAVSIQIGLATPLVKKVIPSNNPITTITTQPINPVTTATTTPATTTTTSVKTTPPIKKEASTSTTPATFTKVPTSALPTSTGKMYRVQIGAFSTKPKIDGVPEVTTVVLENGITKYFSGNYSTYEEAVKRKKEMIEKGFQGAFIVSFENGKILK